MAAKLNPPQRIAVETLSGPMLVLAGAGTGKTRVVTFRIANLIRQGIEPNRILAVTFTNKAALEMKERVGELIKGKRDKQPQIATFHSHCVKVLRRHIRKLGYPEKFAIYDRGDQESVARGVLREIRVPNEVLRPSDLLGFIGQWKCRSVSPEQAGAIAGTDKEHMAAIGYRRYQDALKIKGAVDFDDLLVCTEKLFTEHEDARRDEADRFDHILIDEYQDTNGSQYRIVKALAGGHRNLCVVGDDDQSIYGWRGAEVEHILNFNRDWRDAKVIQLVQNYRSTEAILTMANQLIEYNKTRHDKVLRAERHGGERPRIEQHENAEVEAKSVVGEIQRLIDKPEFEPRDFAILFRTNEQPRAFETELRRNKLPYVLIGGQSFFDRKEVRDILAYMKILAAPDDEVALLRVINTPPRGIGKSAVERLMAQAVERGETVWQTMSRRQPIAKVSPAASRALNDLASLIETWRKKLESGSLVDVVKEFIAKVDYQGELLRIYSDPSDQESRWNAVEEVVNALGGYERRAKKPNLTEFLTEVILGDRDFDNEKDKQLKRNAIVLMTLHSAKGLEYPHVYMVGMEEGFLPHHRSIKLEGAAIDEERRLCYVGITRAQERLTLSMALTRMKWGKPKDSIPSRFLYEMTGKADNPHRPPTPKRPSAKKSPTKVTAASKPRRKSRRT